MLRAVIIRGKRHRRAQAAVQAGERAMAIAGRAIVSAQAARRARPHLPSAVSPPVQHGSGNLVSTMRSTAMAQNDATATARGPARRAGTDVNASPSKVMVNWVRWGGQSGGRVSVVSVVVLRNEKEKERRLMLVRNFDACFNFLKLPASRGFAQPLSGLRRFSKLKAQRGSEGRTRPNSQASQRQPGVPTTKTKN